MATMGFWKSSVFMPVARHRARAPAMRLPCVVVLLRNDCIIALSKSCRLAAGFK